MAIPSCHPIWSELRECAATGSFGLMSLGSLFWLYNVVIVSGTGWLFILGSVACLSLNKDVSCSNG